MSEDKKRRNCGIIFLLSGLIIVLLSILDYLLKSKELQGYIGLVGLIILIIGFFIIKKK